MRRAALIPSGMTSGKMRLRIISESRPFDRFWAALRALSRTTSLTRPRRRRWNVQRGGRLGFPIEAGRQHHGVLDRHRRALSGVRADRVPSRSIAIYPTAGGRSFGMMITGAHRLIRGEGN